jgi:hypothetical protein
VRKDAPEKMVQPGLLPLVERMLVLVLLFRWRSSLFTAVTAAIDDNT